MAEQGAQDKTEAPTPRRREKARQDGNIPKSIDLSAAVLLLGAMVLLSMTGSGIVLALREVMRLMLSESTLSDHHAANALATALHVCAQLGRAVAPFMAGIALVAMVVAVAQAGLNFSTKKLIPKPNQINPINGIKRLFSGGRGMVQLVQNIIKLVLVLGVAYSAIHDHLGDIVAMASLSHEQIFYLASHLIYDIAIRLAIVLLILSVFDYMYQRYRNEEELKMSKQEVRDEMKQFEGDPMMKMRRREIALQRSRQRVRQDVPTSTVIVTNPEHYSVALKYDSNTMNAPRVVAKGVDYMALHIRRIAIDAGVPIVQRPPLARSLYATCKVGDEVPEELFKAVAEILAYVYEISGGKGKQTPVSVS